MGSCNSKEKELNEDLERVRKERIARERAERDRVAKSKLILVKVTSPSPGCEIEINEAVTVRVFLEKVAPLFGLLESDAPSLQAEFSETILGHELELKGAGMCDESLCSVLGVEAAKVKNIDIFKAAREGRIADIKLVLQYAPEKINDLDWDGLTALHRAARKDSFQVAQVLVAANANIDIKSRDGYTALHWAAINNSLEVAIVLVAANANVDIRRKDGYTALDYAKRKNHQEMVLLLTQHLP